MPKHRLRSSSPSSEPPKKRRHTTGIPSSPFSPFSFSYPYIPSSTSYPSRPSDSPSNPFGRTRTWNLLQSLPPETSFSKHLPLRFQYVKRGAPRETLEGIYRIVQVPQSYTLVHLKNLIGFLFGGAYGQIPPDPEEDDAIPSHVFEVKDGITLYRSSVKPGQIMCGNTWAYSSSVLDPYLYSPDWEPEDGSDSKSRDISETEAAAGSKGRDIPDDDVDDDERKWTAEEDITIAHVWPEGGDINRGIIYKHSPQLQIHITINTTKIESRRGRGNLPHVFSACGLVYLEDPVEEDDLEEDRTALLDPENWNEPDNAFATYYNRTAILPFAGYERSNGSSRSIPSLTFSSSPLRASSSSAAVSSPLHAASSSFPAVRIFGSSPESLGFPKFTPAPRPSQRKRIRHLQRRIGTLTRMHAEDEKRGRPRPHKPKKKPQRLAYEDGERRVCSEEL
ncbi:hypothetical protein GGX14DRAFT_661429 [Mycena pura]|uniref:Uncharacterized protein n=1 Tax=Mycena pura TaxID=153505 RepID=A0AAD6Y3K7_9AGAR|nr:hypothetical protein GGX14DRAFT_661429 [Mycena pura]